MKSRWWIAASLLAVLALLVQPGCDTAPELPMEATQDEEMLEEAAASMEMPGEQGVEEPAETPK